MNLGETQTFRSALALPKQKKVSLNLISEVGNVYVESGIPLYNISGTKLLIPHP